MHVLIVIPYFVTWGGPAQVVRELAGRLARRGHAVTIWTTDAGSGDEREAPPPPDEAGVELRVFPNCGARLARRKRGFLPLEMRSALHREVVSFDVVQVIEYRHLPAAWAIGEAYRHRVPVLMSPHGAMPNRPPRFYAKRLFDALFGRRALARVTHFHALTERERDEIIAAGATTDRVTVIPNGLELPRSVTPREHASARQRLGLSPEDFVVLYVGRLHPRKGLDVLIQAAAHAAKQGAPVRVLLVGPDDGAMEDCRRLASREGLSDRVWFTGFLTGERKREVFAAADCFANLSLSEAMPVTVLEALAHGRPVLVGVAAAVDGLAESDAGWIVPTGDVQAAGEGLTAAAAAGPDRRAELGANGRRLVEATYSWDVVAGRYEELLQSLIRR